MNTLSGVTGRVSVISILAVGFILLHGCNFFSPVSEVSPEKFPGTARSKLVVGCFISPQDTVVWVSLTESKPLYDTVKRPSMVANASIVLYNDASDSLVIRDTLSGYYLAALGSFLIEGGKAYRLMVRARDGRAVSATCTVPGDPVPITAISVDSGLVRTVTVGNDPVDSTIERYASVQWKDPAGANYYRVWGQLQQSANVLKDGKVTQVNFTKLLYFNEENARTMIVSDRNQENGLMQSADGVYWSGKYPHEVARQEIIMHLLNTDKTYYDYYQSISQYDQADDNPFAEPVNVKGNITGGYGCFAAFNGSVITLRLK
jgi:hypothetical protein